VPLITGQVISQSYMPGTVNQNGTAYIDNKEYNTLNGIPTMTTISRVHNPEGYASYNTSPYTGFIYYRTDHLGDIREVWHAASKTTIQRTQYYASGLPWATTPADNLTLQPYKYNGKEFVEMNGYDTYDIVWRQYYPAIMRFQTQDPYAEKYYSLSPYTMCADNMVRYTDPDGRIIPIIIAAIAEAPEIYILGAAVVASVTASIHHYQSQHQSSSSYYNQTTTQPATQNAKKNNPPPPNRARQERKQQGHASKNVGAKQKTGHDSMVDNGVGKVSSDGTPDMKGDPNNRLNKTGKIAIGVAAGTIIGMQVTNPNPSIDANEAHVEKAQNQPQQPQQPTKPQQPKIIQEK